MAAEMAPETGSNPWDEHAAAFARWVAETYRDDPQAVSGSSLPGRLLATLGDVAGLPVLDACCGEGLLARLLAVRGARVTGIDLSPRLIELARQKDAQGAIDYRVGDLSRPLPELEGRFAAIGSYMALNDVADHRGFAATLATLAAPGARTALAFNSPYSFVVRGEGHITDYFASGATGIYGGMSARLGGTVRYYHRTLEEYLDAFLGAGFRLLKLVDVPPAGRGGLPMFMILVFEKA